MKIVWRIVTALCLFVSLLSTLRLIRLGFTISFIEPFRVMLDWYQALIELLLGWADPWLERFLLSIQFWIPIKLSLYPQWKHVFVLMWLYVAGDFKEYWARGRTISGPTVLLLGGTVALLASVASGTVQFDSSNMLRVIILVLAFVFFEAVKAPQSATFHRRSGDTWWQTCRYYLINYALIDAVIGATVVAMGWYSRRLQVPLPNVLLLMIFVIAMALRNVVLGARYALLIQSSGGTWTHRFMQSASGRHGVRILAVVAATIVAVAFNAGLS